MTNQQTVGGIVPYPVVGQEDDIGREDQLTEQIQMRLVVTDDHPRTVEPDTVFHAVRELHARDAVCQHHEPRGPVDQFVQIPPFLFRHLPHLHVKPDCGLDDHKHKKQEEQQCIDRPDIFHHPSPESQGQTVDHGEETQHRIQYAYPCEIHARTEMAHTLLLGGIIHVDGYFDEIRAMPGGKDQQFQFCLIFRGEG